MKSLKQGLLDVAAIVFFAVLAFAYFYPADVENRKESLLTEIWLNGNP
jgi:hypothetical protein